MKIMLLYLVMYENDFKLVKEYVKAYCNNNPFSIISLVTSVNITNKKVQVILISQFIDKHLILS